MKRLKALEQHHKVFAEKTKLGVKVLQAWDEALTECGVKNRVESEYPYQLTKNPLILEYQEEFWRRIQPLIMVVRRQMREKNG